MGVVGYPVDPFQLPPLEPVMHHSPQLNAPHQIPLDPKLIQAVVTIQRAFRNKHRRNLKADPEEHAAATKVQSAYRGFRARKRALLSIQAQFSNLQGEVRNKDTCLLKLSSELQLRQGMIEQLGKTVSALRKQLSDITSSYELKMVSKDKQSEQLEHELQSLLAANNELRHRLESKNIEMMKMSFDFREKDSDAKHQYILALQREVEELRSQLSELRSTKEADAIRLSMKDKEIQELRQQMSDARRNLEMELANKSSEVEELRSRFRGMHLHGQQHVHGADSVGELGQGSQMPSTAPAAEGEHGGRPNTVNGTAGPSKSIWGPLDNTIGSFGMFGRDVPSQTSSETLYSNGSSKSSTPPLPATGSMKSIWAPIENGSDFPRLRSADLYGLECGDSFGESPYGSAMMNYGNIDVMDFGPDTMPNKLLSQSQMLGYEKNTASNFHFLVEKIVKTNDQPASLLLQQKLKSAVPEVKNMIFDAILHQALPLMKNRFGNFLMQRCLEFGTPQQVRIIGQTMRGNILSLSCDRFGCHVVQKALDTVEEDLKASLISELFRSIPETITHRFACHVWQRVFEIKWTSEPPAVMHYVDSAIKGQWHHIANDENGSLVVQCVFEHCSEREKAPIVCEILAHCVDIARGQWGNWVIQHVLEHGTPMDKSYIMKVLTHNFFSMSIDQYASKVVEKGLKLAPKREMFEMIDSVIAPTLRENGRPHILDMMNNQFANYVVQHILNLAEAPQRDVCIRLLLPHLNTLRGSKYGQRVAAIVEKHLRSAQHKLGITNVQTPMPELRALRG
ncbi:hypothetical protein HK104_003690 [Borealophlyctis nickersoniae]|nr:hypothetical protein HK104_003690 [Borealophlyctis nickersoniae]